ncbi:hypothetical protein CKAH01_00837 [Colletotrichum kahawae]|uniref:Uncharacterized protein n=1 Tax=Colletotrichum kahawae TaxID=34407 RepID=A0AAD9YKC8_COLKA|nr:hypothetical protein CKAH01_00837 [Colletotrichum kahawae]
MRPGIQSRLVSVNQPPGSSLQFLVFFRLQPGRRSDPNADAGNREVLLPRFLFPPAPTTSTPVLMIAAKTHHRSFTSRS